jgi:hypothetical protein
MFREISTLFVFLDHSAIVIGDILIIVPVTPTFGFPSL